jgi:hypothetical protein
MATLRTSGVKRSVNPRLKRKMIKIVDIVWNS